MKSKETGAKLEFGGVDGEPVQCWSLKRKRDALLRRRRGKTVEALSRERGMESRWLFTPREHHWNAQGVGRPVIRQGNCYATLQSIAQGLTPIFGQRGGDAAREFKPRPDQGTQDRSDHLQNQIPFRGMTLSFAFLQERPTNGVVGRFDRTPEERILYGRTYRNTEEVRSAVAAFVDLYHRHWMLEKFDFHQPRPGSRCSRLPWPRRALGPKIHGYLSIGSAGDRLMSANLEQIFPYPRAPTVRKGLFWQSQ